MIRKALLILLLLNLVLAAAGYAYYQNLLARALPLPEQGLMIEVQRGDTFNHVLARLQQQGVLETIWPAKIHMRLQNLSTKLQAGEFRVPAGSNLPALFEVLAKGQPVRHKVTLVEGITFSEARRILKAQALLTHPYSELSDRELFGLLQQQRESGLEFEVDAATEFHHPEGMLYPDTYYFHKRDSDFSILLRAHEKLLKVLSEEWRERQKDLPLASAYQALILASIVEKETGVPSERAEIAGVFVRRLQKGMRLQTDPTVIYGLGERYAGNITRRHLREKTAYNTYRIDGLPPTPIALVGRDAIHSALNPLQGKSLYFVAKGDGSHQFSETITEHNRAVRKYQLKRREDYRSTHQLPTPSSAE